MKNYIYISLVALAALLLLQACYEDLGNYDYQDTDEVTITFDKKEYETMTRRITIEPTLVSTVYGTIDANNEDHYTYAWLVGRGGSIDTIAQVRQLQDYELALGIAGSNTVYYRVTNKSTGVFSDAKITLVAANPTQQGYMLLCDDNGNTRLDMASWYNNTFNPQFDVLRDILPVQTGPLKIITYNELPSMGSYGVASPNNIATYLLSQSSTERVGYSSGEGVFTYKPEYNVQYQFLPGFCPPGFTAKALNCIGTSPLVMGEVNGKGNLYNCSPGQNIFWGNPVNTLDGSTFFSAASQYAGINTAFWMVFDEDTKSIYRLPQTSAKCTKIETAKEVETPYTNMGKDLVYMGINTYWGGGLGPNDLKFYIILKDPGTGKYWLLRADKDGLQEYWLPIDDATATNMANASCFTVGGLYSMDLFYAVGGTVYKYNIANNKSYPVVDKGAATVTYIGFGNHYREGFGTTGYDSYNYMLVASYDGSTGTVGCYNSEPGTNMWSLYKHPTTSESFEWTGFGKVISIAWKAS